MKKYVSALVAAMLAASVAISMNCASAAPLSGALALKNATPSDFLTVGGWGGGHGWGGGPGWRGGPTRPNATGSPPVAKTIKSGG